MPNYSIRISVVREAIINRSALKVRNECPLPSSSEVGSGSAHAFRMRTAPGVIDALGRRALAGQHRTFGAKIQIVDTDD
ncbi:hypothetical protein P3T43_007266 [Paraburkholderia sp. GAS41]|uniref:hypothetical protein n=1 Tax=Paraburkholderia sp. GAS41 TaxID=3035134 RepID=UPI003D2414B8